MPLQDSKHDEDWGAIDLLGASDDNLPVVVELKAPRSNDSPAEMLVQATAYAVAVKKAWPQCLRSEWASALKIDPDTLPAELSGCELSVRRLQSIGRTGLATPLAPGPSAAMRGPRSRSCGSRSRRVATPRRSYGWSTMALRRARSRSSPSKSTSQRDDPRTALRRSSQSRSTTLKRELLIFKPPL